MGRILSRKEMQKEQAEHAGKDHYKIYYKDETGGKVTVFDFWAKDRESAKNELDIFKAKKRLVDPDDLREYFYSNIGGHFVDIGKGMLEEFDDFNSLLESDMKKESIAEKIKNCFRSFGWWLRDIKYAFADFWFWYRHYDKRTNKSHMRSESWDLDATLLDIIEFNIPLIIKDKEGVPNDFCVKARKKMHEGETGFDLEKSMRVSPNSSEAELKLAERMWDEELGNCMLHIRLYRYYSDGGELYGNTDPAYEEIDRKYKNTIPYLPGTDREIDYAKLTPMIQREWNAIWDWWKKYGQSCWT